MEDIPDDEQECANWLHKLYQEKVKKADINRSMYSQNIKQLGQL